MVQIVVTPGSGAGLALVTARRLRRRLRRRGRETSIRSFDNLARLTQWAETCEPEFSHLVCIGGDATLSAAARAAIRHSVPGEVRRVDVGLARKGTAEEIFLSHRSFGVTYRGFLPLTPTAVPIDGFLDVAVVRRVSKVVLMARLLWLTAPPAGPPARPDALPWAARLVTTPRGREELAVRRRALPLLVPPGALENLQQRAIEDDQALPPTLASERQAPHVTE